jgi:hypothetical protein
VVSPLSASADSWSETVFTNTGSAFTSTVTATNGADVVLGSGTTGSHTETFSTTLYKDAVTSATWDTATGMLKLPFVYWDNQTLDSTGSVGAYTSIALDNNKKVHICYRDETNAQLKYATNASGSWVYTSLDTAINGNTCAIALDSNNKVYISYQDATNSDLKYATNASGSWVYTVVDNSAGNMGAMSSIAIDSNNKIHISYAGDNFLKYATNASGSWVNSIIDNTPNPAYSSGLAYSTSIALDSNDKVHVAYAPIYYGSGWDWDYHMLKYATNASGSWVLTTVEGNEFIDVGQYCSIAMDSNNKAHISYYRSGPLGYATNTSGSWVASSLGDNGSHTSIALDSNDKIHISYYRSGPLGYATNASGSWVYSTADSAANSGYYTSIALGPYHKSRRDPTGNNIPNISHRNEVIGDLKYSLYNGGVYVTNKMGQSTKLNTSSDTITQATLGATSILNGGAIVYEMTANGGTNWYAVTSGTPFNFPVTGTDLRWRATLTTPNPTNTPTLDQLYITFSPCYKAWEFVSPVPSSGYGTYIALDSNKKAHISYMKDNYLQYATNASGSWVYTQLDTQNGWYSSIAVDSNNKVHICYLGNDNLKYATNASGSWVYTVIHPDLTIYDTACSLALDSNNKFHIAFEHDGTSDLVYATNASGSVITTTLDSAGAVGIYPSIALDSNDKVHISYLNEGGGNTLKYATNASGAWVCTTVDTTYNYHTSIAIDSNNKVHIGYNKSNDDLKYATNASGAWVCTTLDSTGNVGQCTSIFLDSNNKVYIGYYDGTNQDLKYATNVSGGWVYSTVDSAGSVGLYTSIALGPYHKSRRDPTGNTMPHISYQGGGVKYCRQYQPYASQGNYVTSAIQPAGVSMWGVLTYTVSVPADTSFTVDVLNASDDSVLAANVASGTNLSYITELSIKLRANFSTSDVRQTALLSDWTIGYSTDTAVQTSNWTGLTTSGKSVQMGQSIAQVKFAMKTSAGTARWKKFRIDKGVTGVNTPCPDCKIEIQVWMENSNNGYWDINDKLIAKGNFANGTCYLNMNRWQVTTTTKTYYIIYKLSGDIGGGQRAGVKIADSSYLEFENATAVGVPP